MTNRQRQPQTQTLDPIMKKRIRSIVLYSFLSAVILSAFNGCNSTRTEDGVTIEKQSGNPLKFW
jgi:hypothetical protein